MYDYSKLRGLIVEKFGTLSAFSEAIGKDSAYISRILHGQVRLTQEIIDTWSNILDIRPERIGAYFFTRKVDNSVTRE